MRFFSRWNITMPLKNYSSLPYGPFHRSDTLKNSGYPCFLMNSWDCRYFRYLYPFLAKNPEIIVHVSKSGQSAQVSNFRSLKQHNFMAHRAFSITLTPSSYPSLQPLQEPSANARQVWQYAPQHPIYLTGSDIFPPWSTFYILHFIFICLGIIPEHKIKNWFRIMKNTL